MCLYEDEDLFLCHVCGFTHLEGLCIDLVELCFPIGILFRLQDVAGYGVGAAVGKIFAEAFPDRTFKSPLVDLLVKSGRNGTKRL